MSEGTGQRIDKWLFFARILKSRSLAQKFVQSGAVRINRDKIDNAARIVRAGDALTFSLNDRVRVLKILDAGERRGPASEAQALYEDFSPPVETKAEAKESAQRAGYSPPTRPPSKKERRAHDRLRWD